ncbi:MAG: cell division protein ZapE [Micrococcales bacterium]
MAIFDGRFNSLTALNPQLSTTELLSQFVPPREFENARFETYLPDTNFESQSRAVALCATFTETKGESTQGKKGPKVAGVYLDGGFGVGKTHLLASIWHQFKGKKVFGSFLAYTGLIGVLGFAETVKELSKYNLVCIDEFELDDPGDTMMLSRLLSELDAKGVKFAATSNTPPNALGQGRFAAADFAREINAMASRFDIVTIDGEDYRHRPTDDHSSALSEAQLGEWLSEQKSRGENTAADNFDDLLSHLATLHPSKYLNLVKGLDALGLTEVYQLEDQVAALRFVAFVDRLYEAQVKLRNTGKSITDIFAEDMVGGAYRKKYLRAVSRLGSLSSR